MENIEFTFNKIKKKSCLCLVLILPKKLLYLELFTIGNRKLFSQVLKRFNSSISSDYYPSKLLFKIEDHTKFVTSACFNPSGDLLATGSNDKTAIIFYFNVMEPRPKFLKPKLIYKDHTEIVSSVTFNNTGEYFATGSYDKTAIIYKNE